MQAYKSDEATDLSAKGYYCGDCRGVFEGEPKQIMVESKWDDEEADWVDTPGRWTPVWQCGTDCWVQERDAFDFGNLGKLVARYGSAYVYKKINDVYQAVRVVHYDTWRCGNCDHGWTSSDYGSRAEQRAVRCCQ